MNITIDRERAKYVFDLFLDAYEKKLYPYDRAQPLQVPEELKGASISNLGKALFLFNLCYFMRGSIQSDTAAKFLVRLYSEHTAIFNPKESMDIEPAYITGLLQKFGLNYNAGQTGKFWIENFRRLNEKWDGNPLNLFEGVNTYKEACARISNKDSMGFLGFREKMVSMLTHFYMDAELINRFNFPPPVDFHALRIVLANKILIIENSQNKERYYREKIVAPVRKFFEEFCKEYQIDPLLLCSALWVLSRTLCGKTPGNQTIIGERKGRNTELQPVPITWDEIQTRRYYSSCGSCFGKETCEYYVPAAPYYIRGELLLRDKQTSPPQMSFYWD